MHTAKSVLILQLLCSAAIPLAIAPASSGATLGPQEIALSSLQLNGNAQMTPSGGITLTNGYYQASSAFTKTPYTFGPNGEFEAYFMYTSSSLNATPNPADGLAFVVQNLGTGSAGYLGFSGSGLGFFTQSVLPAIGVTFDYYANSITGSLAGTAAIAMPTGAELVQTIPTLPVFSNNTQRSVWIYYVNATKTMTVFFSNTTTRPATPILSAVLSTDLSKLLNGQLYFGVTAADGQFGSNQNLIYFALGVSK